MVQTHLIIGGVPKAATTSLFNYLSDHPSVCPANRKETYFFAREFDREQVCTLPQTAVSFETYFSHAEPAHQLKMEATPYTLYAANSAATIKAMLPNATLLFLLRDPTKRLISNFNMQKQRQAPYVKNKTLAMYVETELAKLGKTERPNNVQLGCYHDYLPSFFAAFGQDNVKVLFFEELTANPAQTMQTLCADLGIDPQFFGDYSFNNYNKSVNVRSGTLNKLILGLEPVVAGVRSKVMRHPQLYKAFESSVRAGKFALRNVNDRGTKKPNVTHEAVTAQLQNFYAPHNAALAELLQRPLPWQTAVSTP